MYPKLFITMLSVAVAVIAACDAAQTSAKPSYYIGFVNKTGRDLHSVCAYYANVKVADAGRLVKTGHATEGPKSLPIPAEVEVRWDENENHHTVKIKLEGIVPQDCTIYFILKPDDGVDVKVINLHDTDANAHTTE